MNRESLAIKIVFVISLFLGFQSLALAEKTGKGPKKTVVKDKKCDYPGGGTGSCDAMEKCLLDGKHPGSMSDGTAMCCPKDPLTTPNQSCTMIKTGRPVRLKSAAPNTLGVKPVPTKQPSLRDKMKAKKAAPAKTVVPVAPKK